MKAINILTEKQQRVVTTQQGYLPKKGTIQLGDKTGTYSESEIIWITTDNLNIGRKKIFTAVIDRIYIKTITTLTVNDMFLENPSISSTDEMEEYLAKIYNTPVTPNDIVTVITYYQLAD